MFSLNNPIIRGDMESIFSSEKCEKLKNSSIYISGAAGMIASYLVMYLIYLNEIKDYQLEIYAGIRNYEKAKKRFGSYIKKDYFHIIYDDVISFDGTGFKVDYIIHAASLASPQYYGKMPVETMLPNIIGTYKLLDYAVKSKIKGFLFFSSGSVYGSVKDVDNITENTVATFDFLAPGNVYGESKRCGETLCKAYFNEYQVPVKLARIHHTYGPTMDIENDKRAFSEFTANIVHNEDIEMKSDGSAKRAFCYLGDAIEGLLKILLYGEDGESYNIGNDEEYVSIYELATRLVELFPERGLKVIRSVRNDSGYKISPENRMIPLNIEKIKKLGWKPHTSLEGGFAKVIRYFLEADNRE